jgi:adenosylhomocysteine nucleosidase
MSAQPAPVGVVCALAIEARHLARTARMNSIQQLDDGTLVCVSGMGAAAAVAGARALIDAGAVALLSWGMAGGLDPALAAGALFLPSYVAARSGGFATAEAWRERLGAALQAHRPIVRGTLYTSPTAVDSVAAKAALFRDTGASAVDMEGLHVAAVAGLHALPFIAIKVIIDGAGDALPPALAAAAGAAESKLGPLAWALARSPRDLASLWRLGLRYRSASRTLAAAARIGFRTPAGSDALRS